MTFEANEIEKNIWLGSEESANAPLNELYSRNIKFILICARGLEKAHSNEEIEYHQINALDFASFNILQYAEETFNFIERSISSSHSILVHCVMGRSRSASIVILYLMKKYKMAYTDAFLKVKKERGKISLNEGFVRQCVWFEEMNFNLIGNSPAHLTYYSYFRISPPLLN